MSTICLELIQLCNLPTARSSRRVACSAGIVSEATRAAVVGDMYGEYGGGSSVGADRNIAANGYPVNVAMEENATFQKFFLNLMRWISPTTVTVLPPSCIIPPKSVRRASSSGVLTVVKISLCL